MQIETPNWPRNVLPWVLETHLFWDRKSHKAQKRCRRGSWHFCECLLLFFISGVLCCVKLPMGRACIDHYRLLKRQCVFSHDELVCKMASLPPGTLDLTMSVMVYQDMVVMVEEERKLRKQLLDSVCIFFLDHCILSNYTRILCSGCEEDEETPPSFPEEVLCHCDKKEISPLKPSAVYQSLVKFR